MVAVHFHFAFDDLAFARRAHACLARVRQFGALGVAGVKNALAIARQVERQRAAVADDGDLANGGINLASCLAGLAFLLAADRGKQFEMDAFVRHAFGFQAVAHGFGHLLRAADERGVEGFDVDPAREQLLAFLGVDPTVVQVDILLFAAEHEDQVQTLQVAVFQVFELFAKQRAGAGTVAVQQRDAAMRFGLQGGLDDRQDRRDAAARRDREVVAMASRVEVDMKVPGWWHHLQAVPGLQLLIGERRETSTRHTLDGDTQFAVVDPGADRVGPAYFFAVHLSAHHQVLALGEVKTVLQVLGNLEGDGHRVTGLGAHVLDGQAVKFTHYCSPAGTADRRSDAFEIVERFPAIDAAVQRLAGG
jgi:hypothetical protein